MTCCEDHVVDMIPYAKRVAKAAFFKYGMEPDDVEQEALLRALERKHLIDASEDKQAYISTIIRGSVFELLQRRSAMKRSMLKPMDDDMQYAAPESDVDAMAKVKVEKVLAEVPQANAAIFKAIYEFGFSSKEVASATGRSKSDIARRSSSALNAIAAAFGVAIEKKRERSDDLERSFENSSGDRFTGTRVEFGKYSGLNSGAVHALVKGSATVRGGWRIVT